MKPITYKLFILFLVTAILLSACNLSFARTPQVSPEQLEAITAATVAARLTQISVQTLVAQVTQQAMIPTATVTPEMTFTPTVTNTPTATATPLPPTWTPVPPTATATSIPCNLASFITDVTIPDNTTFTASQGFVKTWRIKNIGSCNWTTSYSIYFVNGNAMSAPASVAFPKTVKPGETVDLSVSMYAPASKGDYSANWMLKDSYGNVFGVGAGGNVALSIAIKVKTVPVPFDPNTIYDFVGNFCAGQWRTNAGSISCPTNSFDYKNGTITRTYAPVLENGVVDDEGALITIPAVGGDGMIQGQFPKLLIHAGDHFKATLLCSHKMTKCSVTYEVLYKEFGTDTVTSLGTWDKTYDNSYIPVDVDLSALDGKEVIFYLKVISKGDPTNDFAQWMAARITHP